MDVGLKARASTSFIYNYINNNKRDHRKVILIYITWLFCESKNNKEFIFNAFGLNNVQDTVAPTVLFACCSFMRVLDKEMISLGKDKNGEERSHYTIKQFLLEVLSISLEECAASEISRGKAEEIVRFFKILETCRSLSQTVSLVPEAFSALKRYCNCLERISLVVCM